MNIILARISFLILILSPLIGLSQRGKNNDFTVTTSPYIVNAYTTLSTDASAGATSISVANSSLIGGFFTTALAAGDLIMIIQMQGASVNVNTGPTVVWGGNYTWPEEWWNTSLAPNTTPWIWGTVTNYNNAGKQELVEVRSVNVGGANTIQLNCALQNSYTATGKVQIVRVPRFNNLTINAGLNMEAQAWNGTTGGVVAVEVNGNLTLNANSKISATAKGFRGAVADNAGFGGTNNVHTNGTGNGSTQLGSSVSGEGGRKGEGIAGYTTEYTSVLLSPFGRGSVANGGGGGGYNNAGGGGGANIGSATGYTGKGVPSTTYANSVWNLETAAPGFGGSVSPGGGRGGYTYANSNQNELTLGPNQLAWLGDSRKENGGFGGHQLAYDATRLFMGGGGGAGDQNDVQGGGGGTGGGIVHVTCYGTISGTGSFEADGAGGQNSNPNNQPVTTTATVKGRDGAGGGGGGGMICVKNLTALPATLGLNARGGVGGNQVLSYFLPPTTQEAGGPGGGGAGGGIIFTSGTPTQSVAGGNAGTTNSTSVTNFPVNGATGGGAGISGLTSTIFNITASNVSICSGNSATLTATVTGTAPGTLTWYSQQFGGTSIGTGTSFTTPVLTTTTTYYVGICPGTFRIPVTVTVTPSTTAIFTQIAPLCQGIPFTLPTTSNNSISGTWSPAINTSTTTTYTFTPNAGQCGTGTTMTVTINPNVTPTFTQVNPVCQGVSFTLPSSSNNGINGSWSPVINTNATTTYTFTPTAGQCANTTTMSVTVNPATVPTFTQIPPICSGGSISLPSSSNNTISGTWSPAINNTATTTYTFTPTAGQCASNVDMTVTVNQPLIPTFDPVPPICSGGSIILVNTSTNGITGTWSPAINNTATTTYTFTPTVGQCATSPTLTVSVGAPVTPTFNAIPAQCSNGSFNLPATSNEGFTGMWSPAINMNATTTYTFTPTAGQCANNGTLTVTITNAVNPTFTPITAICSGGTISLPSSSLESITGTWTPAINNTATTTYTFAPIAGQCANSGTLTVIVNQPVTPSFTQISPICSGESIILPTTSTNAINGSWTPAINNTSTTLYTFTPATGQCASTTDMTVTVNQPVLPSFTQVSPICSGGTITLPTTSANSFTGIWSPSINNTATTTYTFTPTAGQCASTVDMTVTVNQPLTPTFTSWGPYCQDAILAQVMLPSTSLEGINGSWNPGMVSTSVAGNIIHTFTPSPTECANVTTMTVVVNANVDPTFDAIAPICSGGSITLPTTSLNTINGTWSPAINNTQTTTYTFTPTTGQCANATTLTVNVGLPVTPTFSAIPAQCEGSVITLSNTSLEGFTGTWSPAINNLSTTTYTFTPIAGQCATTSDLTVVVNAPIQASFAAVGPFCSGSNFTLPATSNEGFTGSWSPAVDNQNTTSYTFTVDAGQCAQNGTLSVAISTNPTIDVTGALLSNENCNQQDGSISGITITGGTPAYNYEWNNNGTLNTLDLQGLSAGNYDLTVTDQLGCTATISLLLEEIQAPTIDASNLMVVQPTCLALGSIDGLQVTGNPPFTYNWTNTSQTSLSINNLIDGTYNLTVEDQNGCTSVYGPIVMTTPNGPTASFTWSPQEPNLENQVNFTNTSTATANFTSEWTIIDTTITSTNSSYIFMEEGEFPITLIITDNSTGCVDSITNTIMIFGEMTIPNIITANNDNANDEFFIKGLKENTYLVILNRWGNVVFETDNYQNDWKGYDYKTGEKVTNGVYTYLIKTLDGKTKHGIIHIIE